MRQLLGFIRPFLRPLALAVGLTGALTVVGMAPPLLMRRLVNDVAAEGNWGLFPLVMALMFAVPLLQHLINVANSLTLNKVTLAILGRVRKQVFARLLALPLEFFDRMPLGAMTQRMVGDVGTVAGVATGGIITLLTDVIAVGFAVTIMFSISWQLSLLTFALVPLYFLNYRFFSRRIRDVNAMVRSHMDHISSNLQERLGAHELTQSYAQEEAEGTHFSTMSKQIMAAAVRGAAYSTSYNQLAAFLDRAGNTLIYCAGCYYFVKGTLGFGDVIAFCAYATQILGPVVRFSNVLSQLLQVGVSIDRLNEILSVDVTIKDKPDSAPVEDLQGDIHIHGVTFGYRADQPVLQDVQLDIAAGTHLAMVGTSGAGRSTLAMLLRRFYDPHVGKIEVDGRDIRDYRLRDYRESIALISSESAVFDGTIRENLRYGKPDAPEERMIEVSQAVGLHDFVGELAQGYDTRIGTGGLKIAADTQQQIGIARTLISEPFILIADQATSTMDPVTAHQIHEAMRQAMEGRTAIMIVYRVLLAEHAQRVVVMDDGKVVESGERGELARKAGSLYRAIYAKQYGEGRLPPVRDD